MSAQEAMRVSQGHQVHCSHCGHHFVTVAKVPTCSKCHGRRIVKGVQTKLAWWLR